MSNPTPQSIGQKLQRVNLLVSSGSSLFVVVLMSTLLFFSLENGYTKRVDALCALLSDNISIALASNDPRAASDTLKTLDTVPDLAHAYVFDRSGNLFARFDRPADTTPPPLTFESTRYRQGFRLGELKLYQVVSATNSSGTVGTIVVQMDLTSAYRQLAFEIGLLILSSLIGFLLISKLLSLFQHSITRPLSELTSVMQKVSTEGNFTLRAGTSEVSEIDMLSKSFNQMLGELAQRDAAMKEDLHQREIIEAQLSENNERFGTVLRALPDLMFEMDIQGRFIDIWGGKPDLLANAKHEMIGRLVSELLPPEAAGGLLSSILKADKEGFSGGEQIMLNLPQGERWFELSVAKMTGEAVALNNFVVLARDITDRKQSDEEIKYLAYYDPLTGLANRRLLVDRLQHAFASSARSGLDGAILFIDLDNFKILNDTLGHEMGDLLLQQVAQRLKSCVREVDTVARLGGDEFVVMLVELRSSALESATHTLTIADKILAALNCPYDLAGHEYRSTPSIGATLFSNHKTSIEELLKQADIAMYQSKQAGRNTLRFFDPRMQETLRAKVEMEAELRVALEVQQFRLYYQIQMDRDHKPIGAETLIRWIHPVRGFVSPAAFISLAEENGLIIQIGSWVLETACAQLKVWQNDPSTRDLVIAVNVSAKQFHQNDFVQQVQHAIQSHEIAPHLLKLELTESLLVDNIEDTIATMNALSQLGVKISLDDFGTGYSSLQYLKRLPLSQLKIDQSFVRDLVHDNSDKAIVRTIIAMAHSLNLDVIAEGVEAEEQRRFLLDSGCVHFQGYLFGKPVPIDQFDMLLKSVG